MNRFIRYRLVTIVLLGVLTSAMSVVGLVQLLKTTTAQRIERSRDAVADEVERLAREPKTVAESPTTLVSLRAGVVAEGALPEGLPAWSREPVLEVSARARTSHARATVEVGTPEGTVVVAAQPVVDPRRHGLPADATVFAAFQVRPVESLRVWQRIVTALAALTVLLVAIAVYSVYSANRGAAALRRSLEMLASDLNAPVARPSLGELDAIADGIEELARKLAAAREMEGKLAKELAQNERLAALGRVAAGVAHEVRNPLASIKLRLDLAMASPGAIPDSAQKAIAHATSEIERLDRLVADLLVITGKKLGEKRRVEVGELVRSRVEGLVPWAKERSVSIAASGEGAAVVETDSVARAIDNLLRNAVEASPANGVVTARVAPSGDALVVRVEDDGVGVPSARRAELFEPFFTTKPSGTGLGLALSRAIAQAHGGDLVYERLDRRTRFDLTLAADDG